MPCVNDTAYQCSNDHLCPTFFFLMKRQAPRSTLFPYTTLFRSRSRRAARRGSSPTATLRAERECARSVAVGDEDRKSTRLNFSHVETSYAVFCLKKKKIESPAWGVNQFCVSGLSAVAL